MIRSTKTFHTLTLLLLLLACLPLLASTDAPEPLKKDPLLQQQKLVVIQRQGLINTLNYMASTPNLFPSSTPSKKPTMKMKNGVKQPFVSRMPLF
ncbi:MAG: hypothetical protein P8179_12875 [Candidatus Thiodiazotropha sp.]